MLTISHIENIKNKLSSISSLDELEKEDKQLFDLVSKHYTFSVGIDVSQDEFSINVKKTSGETIYTDTFENHHAGFCKLYETFTNLNDKKEYKFQVAIESTGPYHKALVRFLQEKGIEVMLYNAQTAKHLAKAYLKEKKTDKIDANILALLKIDGKFPVSQTEKENEFIEIRSYSRRSSRYAQQVALAKTRLKDELIQASKGMLLVFPNQAVFNKGPIELLKKYPLPCDRLSAGILEVTRILREYSNNKYGEEEAEKLLSFDKENQPDKRLFSYFRQSILDYIDEIEYYDNKRHVYNKKIDEMTAQKEKAQNLLSLTGCGPTLMPVILGEVGNINRFTSAKHFAGFAGFVPVECESGPKKGEKHVKNGASARLSHACFMIANCIRRYDERLKSLYTRLKERHIKAGKTKGIAHLIANCAVAREVSILIYNILKYNRKYYKSKDDYKAYKASMA
jgi:transposase